MRRQNGYLAVAVLAAIGFWSPGAEGADPAQDQTITVIYGKIRRSISRDDPRWDRLFTIVSEKQPKGLAETQAPGGQRPEAQPSAPADGTGVSPSPGLSKSTHSEDSENSKISEASKLVAGSSVGLLGVVLAYVQLVAPWRRRRPLRAALAILERDVRDELPQAESLLLAAMSNGLRGNVLSEARFALAYVRAQLGSFKEALALVRDLRRSGASDVETIYLELWLSFRAHDSERVESIYLEHQDELSNFLDAKMAAGIACLERALDHWAAHEIEAAIAEYERLRALNVLVEELPTQIDDHQVVLGTQALYQADVDKARKHFEGALATAQLKKRPTHRALFGIALCNWRKQKLSGLRETLEELLGALGASAAHVRGQTSTCACGACGRRYRVWPSYEGKEMSCRNCRKRFKVNVAPESAESAVEPEADTADLHSDLERLLDDDDLLLRNGYLLLSAVMIKGWLDRPAGSGLDALEISRVRGQTTAALSVDEDFADARLFDGLLEYFFAESPEHKQEGLRHIEESIDLGVHLPEVLSLRDRARREAEKEKKRVEHFSTLLRNYLSDAHVAPIVKEKIRKQLEHFQRFQELNIEGGEELPDRGPSTHDLLSRGELIRKRITAVLGRKDADVRSVEKMLDRYDAATKALRDRSKDYEVTEGDLIGTTGEMLFKEEEHAS